MNPYIAFSDILFTCIDGPINTVSDTVVSAFNEPSPWVSNSPIRYFVKEVVHDVNLAYSIHAERDTTKLQRIVFWEPRLYPGKTFLMGRFHDGLSHSIFRVSKASDYTWVNVRMYNDPDYPGVFLDYYAKRRTIMRRLMSCKDEAGWDFVQDGPLQTFERPAYYSRRAKQDRLNRDILTEYLGEIGYDVLENDCWKSDIPARLLWQERSN